MRPRGCSNRSDSYLQKAGVGVDSLTDATRLAVTIGDKAYGLPFDTHGGLFHVNTALFAKAGLMRGGKPVLPTSADELLAQARQFKARTGKPYLIQSNVGDPAYAARNLYTYMMAQGAVLFPSPKRVDFTNPKRSGSPSSSSASTRRSWGRSTWTRRRRSPRS